jgi:predicted ATP-grasp superfamily ATP-dependent carboligase
MGLKGKPFRILVTDAQELAGLGAVRSLGRAGYTAIAAYPEGLERPASVWSRYCSGELRYPDSWRYQFEFRDWLRDRANNGAFDAVLPISEASVFGVASVRKDLPGEILPILPSDSALEFTLSKFLSTRMVLSLGIACPATVFINDGTPTGEWNNDLSRLRFPIIIKTDNHLTAEGAYVKGRHFVCTEADEATRILRDLKQVKTRIIAQEMIPGRGLGVFLLRFGGTIHLRFAHRRLHEVPYTGGYSSFRESYRDDALVSLGEAILEAIGYEGVAMIEFRRGAIDGKPYFLEINGRLWRSLALALYCGVDFPRALVECYQNGCMTRNPPDYRAGIKCRNIFPGELHHLISILDARATMGSEPPPSKLGAVARFLGLSLNPTIRHDHLWWTDPLPGVVQAIHTAPLFAARIIKKVTRKFRKTKSVRHILQTARNVVAFFH